MVNTLLDKYNTTMSLNTKEWLVLLMEYNKHAKAKLHNGAVSCGSCKTKIVKLLNARVANG